MFNNTFAQSIIPRFAELSVNEGLSQSSVYAIYQDKAGYLWIGTADGLNRYDGKEIKVYKPVIKQSEAGFSNFIRGNVCEDKNSNLWYVNGTGIFCYNRLKDSIDVVHYYKDNTHLEERLVFVDSAQILWSFNINRGISSYNSLNGEMRMYPFPFALPKNMRSGDLYHHIGNRIFFSVSAYFKDGYYIFDTETKKYQHVEDGKQVSNIFSYGKNAFAQIEGDSFVVNTMDLVSVKKIPLPSIPKIGKYIYHIVPDNYGRIWVATANNGLFCYREKDKKYVHYTHNNAHQQSLSFNLIRTLFIDRNENLWIGTDGGGLSRLDLKPAKFNLFPLNEGDYPFLKDYFTKCFYEDEQGKIWAGTLSGLNILNPKDYSVKNYRYDASDANSLPGNYVTDIMKDPQGRIWVAGNTGLALFDETNGKFHRIQLPNKLMQLSNAYDYLIYRMIPTTDGEIAAATASGMAFLHTDSKGKIHARYVDTGFLSMGILTDIDEVQPGEFWFTSPTNGLYHFQKRDSTYIFKESFLPNIDLRCIHPDEEDRKVIWIGSGIGLIRFDTRTKQNTVFNEEDGLSNSYVYGILEDEQHQLWLSTNGGIFRFDKQTHAFIRYNVDYGLQSNEFNTGAYYKGQSGNFYFGGIKGFNWLLPSDVISNAIKPIAAISQISINDVVHHNDTLLFHQKRLRLPYNQNDLVFKMAALDFTMPEANRFQYKLRGWDKDFIISDHNTVRYSRLPPGTYVFQLKVSNSDNVWSETISYYITIAPPVWRTWWFYTIAVIALTVFLLVMLRAFVKSKLNKQRRAFEKQKALDEERHRISREMHDDIGAGLTQISLMSEVAKSKIIAREELESIAQTSRKLVHNMSEIIWSMNPANNAPERLFAYLREHLHEQLEYSGISYELHFPEIKSSIMMDNTQKRNILLAVKVAVNNAVKHSQAQNITVTAGIEITQLWFEIKDDGHGFDPSKQASGNGLVNIRYRIAALNGTLILHSAPMQGTLLRYHLPLK